MKKFKIFIELTRLNKPIGYMLLFWPCSWGLAIASYYEQTINNFYFYLILFFLGSILMRSAGCIFNDIVDRDIDRKVERTRKRPLASKKLSLKLAFFYIFILCLIALLILLQFNYLTVFLGLGSMFLAFTYPFMKRLTYWPQLFLGITFNWGIIMAWTAITNQISMEIFMLYTAAIFWTLGYDTIYGLQDIKDDEIIGMKSTSIKFKNYTKLFVSICYIINSLIIMYIFQKFLGFNFFSFMALIYLFTLIFQVYHFNKNSPKKCLAAFKLNNFSGLTLFICIFSLQIY